MLTPDQIENCCAFHQGDCFPRVTRNPAGGVTIRKGYGSRLRWTRSGPTVGPAPWGRPGTFRIPVTTLYRGRPAMRYICDGDVDYLLFHAPEDCPALGAREERRTSP